MFTSVIKQIRLDPMKDFSRATYTAIISDLHLCEAEPPNLKHPLWKKYKTKEFFFDKEFADFLLAIEKKAQGDCVELILNGDIFDFDSVTALPEKPIFRISWLEKKRGLNPQEAKSVFKMDHILSFHPIWVKSLREFILRGNRVVIIIGNHDLEMHFPDVKRTLLKHLALPVEYLDNLRFNDWFYISNQDTLVEHGNQYDPYCVIEDPTAPFIRRFNLIEVKVPFGNMATRYMINGMGFFNPHDDANYVMSAGDYVKFFLKYMLRAQPFLVFSWFWGSVTILIKSFINRLRPSVKDPFNVEDNYSYIARKANATPRIVRELKQLFVDPASSNPVLIARELWLDRAFILLLSLVVIFQIFLFVETVYDTSLFWTFIPILIFAPFFMFYSKSVVSNVSEFKEPYERTLSAQGLIAGVSRVVYGHTHLALHQMIGPIEHLNSGTWSPSFKDVECTQRHGKMTLVWIAPNQEDGRDAELLYFKDHSLKPY